ncbi:response regulator receiver domain protein [delta proteobacterium NaphS2]|nr:response regulator receiver domain protein [delta proteobacterium NaphS2]
MNQETEEKVLLFENDPTVLEKIDQAFLNRNHKVIRFSTRDEALDALKGASFDLLLVGLGAEEVDPIEVLRTFVMASPMSSVITITDLSDDEIHEKAEGYGILGNIPRDVPSEQLFALLDTHEKIHQSLRKD